VVPDILKLFPYQFASSLPQISRYLPAKNTIYNAKNVERHAAALQRLLRWLPSARREHDWGVR
jgi:hypothetical protein